MQRREEVNPPRRALRERRGRCDYSFDMNVPFRTDGR
jgi:hypothetical protein